MKLQDDENAFFQIFGFLQWAIILGLIVAVAYGAFLAYEWATEGCTSDETTAECIARNTTEGIGSALWGGIVGAAAGLWNTGKKATEELFDIGEDIGESTSSWLPWNWF